jgi:hypothetical protein
MIARRRGLGPIVVAVVLAACSVEGEDVATTFFDPTANSSTPPTTSAGDTEGTSGSSGSGGANGSADSGDSSPPPATESGSDGGSSGSPPVDEQPEDGMYSECAGVGECIGLTTCVVVGATGFCSGGCADPVQDCDINPSATSTAPALCVDNGAGLMVCALGCAAGQTCPGGMECMPLGASMVCA